MAIKTSNPITITEQKIVTEIKEWYLATSLDSGVTTNTPGWTTSVQIIDPINKYLWNYEEVVYSLGSPEISEPVMVGVYTKGIKNIVNYYAITEDPELPIPVPNNFWVNNISSIGLLSNTNKYLWNYEAIIYTDDTYTNTDAAIIGVYGDSGENAVIFQVYSPLGNMFTKDIHEIELKTASFSGANMITGSVYEWSYYVPESDSWIVIGDTINLVISETDEYALSTFKCVMTYEDMQYEDYYSLQDYRSQYSAVIKFFGGTNTFGETEQFLIAYTTLYKDGQEVDPLTTTNYYYSDTNSREDIGEYYKINTNFDNTNVVDWDTMYFVLKDEYGTYWLRYAEYNPGVAAWIEVEDKHQYAYKNTLFAENTSKAILINRRDIVNSAELSVNVYNTSLDANGNQIYNNDLFITETYAIINNINGLLSETINTANNIKQYMTFDPDNGLKIAQQSDKFYVQIEATEMGFYDNTNASNPHNKIVNIGTNSATIKNMTVISDGQTPATFNCDAQFNQTVKIQNFAFQVEQNGSFSLVLGN